MAKTNKADMSCARVKKYTASDVSKAERHIIGYSFLNHIHIFIGFILAFVVPFRLAHIRSGVLRA